MGRWHLGGRRSNAIAARRAKRRVERVARAGLDVAGRLGCDRRRREQRRACEARQPRSFLDRGPRREEASRAVMRQRAHRKDWVKTRVELCAGCFVCWTCALRALRGLGAVESVGDAQRRESGAHAPGCPRPRRPRHRLVRLLRPCHTIACPALKVAAGWARVVGGVVAVDAVEMETAVAGGAAGTKPESCRCLASCRCRRCRCHGRRRDCIWRRGRA